MVRISNLQILEALRQNSRTPFLELARRFGVSETAVRKRVRKLEQQGIIRKYTIEVDPRKAGFQVGAIVGIDTEPDSYVETMDSLKKEGEIMCLSSCSGDHMIMAECWFRDREALSGFLKQMKGMKGVRKVCPAIIGERIK